MAEPPDERPQRCDAVKPTQDSDPGTVSSAIFDFVASVLLLEHPSGLGDAERAERAEFVLRFQQLTAPVMAKGFEDTALYRYYPLASLNETRAFSDKAGRRSTRPASAGAGSMP